MLLSSKLSRIIVEGNTLDQSWVNIFYRSFDNDLSITNAINGRVPVHSAIKTVERVVHGLLSDVGYPITKLNDVTSTMTRQVVTIIEVQAFYNVTNLREEEYQSYSNDWRNACEKFWS